MTIADPPEQSDVLVHPRAYPAGHRIGLHVHREAQFLYSMRGVMEVSTPRGRWLTPPHRAIWAPAGLEHSVAVLAPIEMRAVFIRREWLARRPEAARLGEERVVEVGPLLRESVLAMFGRDDPGRLDLLAQVVLMEIADAQDCATFMPLPADPRARRAADLILADPADAPGVEEIARAAGSSTRTLARLFATETGLSFKAWRQRARIMRGVALLGDGRAVKDVARTLGFSSAAAFGHAFRQVTGATPAAFFGEARPNLFQSP